MGTSIEELLQARYYQPGERNWEDLVERVINHVYQNEPDLYKRADAWDTVYDKAFLPSSPVLMNAGTRYPMLCSCFVLPVSDSIEDIMTGLSQTAYIQKFGGGVGIDFSPIRKEGSRIASTNGIASGPVSFMGLWNEAMNVIKQGGKRQGAMMGVLRVDHPDLEYFLRAKRVEGRLTNFNLSVAIDKEFWQLDGCDDLLREIANHTWVNGEPGVLFLDNINRRNPYGTRITATNPCWSGETLVWTAHGPRTFSRLASDGQDVQVLTQTQDGQLTFRTMRNPRQTGTAPIWELRLNNGAVLRATGNHNVILKDGTKRMVKDLQPGNRLASVYRYKANQKGYLRLTNGIDEPLEHHVAVELVTGRRPDYPEEHCHHKDGNPTNNVPENLEVLSAHEHNQMGMLGEDNPMAGIWDERNPLYSRDVSGENNPRYRADVTVKKVKELKDKGLTHQQVADVLGCSLKPVKHRWKLAQAQVNHVVQEVRLTEETAPVYNGTVEETHTYFVLAGGENEAILSANCGEVPLPPYGACNLGSINLNKALVWDKASGFAIDFDRLRDLVRIGVEFLNHVLDTTWWPFQELADFQDKHRPIGLGVMGLADCLALQGLAYGTMRGRDYVHSLFAFIQKEAANASYAYHVSRRNESRMNAVRLAIAPTGTISMLAGASYGIEPYFTFAGTKKVEAGSFTIEEPLVEAVATNVMHDTLSSEDQSIIRETGSVQKTGLRVDTKAVLRTATEIPWSSHIAMQAAIQEYVDSSVSKTINMPNDASVEDVRVALSMAHSSGCKGVTIYRSGSRRDEVMVAPDNNECPSGTCEL